MRFASTSSSTIRRPGRITCWTTSQRHSTACPSIPQRGNYPKELLDIGIREYREVFFKPYRIIYRVVENNVYVLMMADGRRDMQTLLQRRLLQT